MMNVITHDRLKAAFTLIVFLIGIVVLIGWHSRLDFLIQIHPTFVPMQYNTALGFLLSACGLIFLYQSKYRYSALFGVVVLALGLLTLCQYIFAVDFKIDQLLMEHYIVIHTPNPGRMAPNTALCFSLSGLSLVFLSVFHQLGYFRSFIASALAAMIIGLGAVAGFGYLTGLISALGWGNMTQMALHTSIGFMFFGGSLLLHGKSLIRERAKYKYWMFSWAIPFSIAIVACLFFALESENDRTHQRIVEKEGKAVFDSITREITFKQHSIERVSQRWFDSNGYTQALMNSDFSSYITDFNSLHASAWIDNNGEVAFLRSQTSLVTKNSIQLDGMKGVACPEQGSDVCYKIKNISGFQYLVFSISLNSHTRNDGWLVNWISLEDVLLIYQEAVSRSNLQLVVKHGKQQVFPREQSLEGKYSYTQSLPLENILLTLRVETNAQYQWFGESPLMSVSLVLLSLILIALIWVVYISASLRNQRDNTRSLFAKNESILNVMIDGLLIVGRDGVIQEVNQPLCNMFGYQSPDELVNQPLDVLIPSSVYMMHKKWLNSFFNEQGHAKRAMGLNRKIEGKHRSGEKLSLQVSLRRNRSSDQEVVYAAITDITQHQYIEEQLKKKEQLIERAFNASFAGIYVYNISQGVNDFINDAYTKITGYTHEALNALDETTFLALFHRDDQQKMIDHIKDVVNSKKGDATAHNIEYRFKHSEGHWIWCFSQDVGFEFDENGKMTHFIGCFLDITERKAIEERIELNKQKLEESEQRYNLAITGSGVGIWDWDVQSGALFWSDKMLELLGYSPTELEVDIDTFKAFLHPDDREETWAAVTKNFTDNTPYEKQYRMLCKKGEYRWFKAMGKATFNENGEPLRMAGSFEDIHESKLLEIALHETNKELEEFAFIASHDLKEPVRTLNTFSNYLLSDVKNNKTDRIEQDIEYIQSASIRLTNLIDDILELSRVGSTLLEKSRTLLKPLFEDIVLGLQTQIEETSTSIEFELDVIQANIDKVSFRQVIQNLIQNAIKYHREGVAPIIVISTELSPDNCGVLIHVQDNGIGIEESQQSHIFGIFKKLHSHTEYPGNGIGLAIVLKTIRRHGGSISITSTVNEGSRFSIFIPDEELSLIHI